jgi:hypothetical protein
LKSNGFVEDGWLDFLGWIAWPIGLFACLGKSDNIFGDIYWNCVTYNGYHLWYDWLNFA